MDARVNDFLNEINEIAPLTETKPESVWEKCYDEESGYYYYWNTKSNEVTWDMPPDYKSPKSKSKRAGNLYVPPRTAPLFPSTSVLPPVSEAVKIYKIGESATESKSVRNEVPEVVEEQKKIKQNQDLDEKVVLISSYGDGSDSEEEPPPKGIKISNGSKTPNFEDKADILTRIQKKVLDKKFEPSEVIIESKESKGLSLVAGYSDSEEESESETSKPNFPIIAPPPEENKISHSTLFPVTKPIDVKDFEIPAKTPEEEDFDSKAFQRKKRIGVALVNTGKKVKADEDNERKGLGFSGDGNTENFGSSYPGFKSGGVMFVKSDVLNPPAPPVSEGENNGENSRKMLKEIDETFTTLKEKLGFLSEGREEVSPVQVMMIQLQTLYTALKSGDLKPAYLRKWLDETCSDLVKLEKETTPEGWLLQWDRSHKRYYYQNAATGESQWEYPQADVTVCDEAMDICTTPPPNGAEPPITMSPPLPPTISSPSPPPPPTISDCKPTKKKKCDIPLPPEPKETVERYDSNGEPLPPGVDTFEKDSKSNDLNDVLNSFYSDIAAIETSNSPVSNVNVTEEAKTESVGESVTEPAKKKKKTKVKLAQGIAMKKKGVSKLVEKWKSVQMSYNE